MSGEYLSSSDAFWLQIETPTNLMMISAFFEFDCPLDYERLRATIEHRLLRFERFRQRVVKPRLPLGMPRWETDPTFDLDCHLHHIALPPPGDKATMQQLVDDLASTPLDYTKPLWQFHLIEGCGEGCLLFCRLHHCIADGIALMQVLLSLCDDTAGAPWPKPTPVMKRRPQGFMAGLLRPAMAGFASTQKVANILWNESTTLLRHPDHALELAQTATGMATSLGRVALLPPDPQTIFKGQLGTRKRTAWSEPLPLPDVKLIGRAVGGTINDVLSAAVAGALRRYLQERDQPVDGVEIRAMVPFNLRSPDVPLARLGNEFALVVLALPVGIEEPVNRLLETKYRMDRIKRSDEPLATYSLLRTVGMTPVQMESLVVRFFASKTSVTLTNVPGPQQTVYLAGTPIHKIMGWVPQGASIGLGISIFSYRDEIVLGVLVDANLVPDPQTIVDAFQEEVGALRALIGGPREVAVGTASHRQDGAHAHCQALTQEGLPCSNPARPGSSYCHVHADVALAQAGET